MKSFIAIFCSIACLSVSLAGCGGGGGTPGPTVATTKMYLFGTMSSASTGGSAGIVNSINTTVSALPEGMILTSITPSGAAVDVPASNASWAFIGATRDLSISLLNTTDISVKADSTSNGGKGVELATLNFTLTGGTTTPIPTLGTDTTVFQYRSPVSANYLNGCIINFTTTYH